MLADLEANPSVMRTMRNRFEDRNLIVTLAIRDVGTCELLIPAERFDRSKLSDYAALLACLTGRVERARPARQHEDRMGHSERTNTIHEQSAEANGEECEQGRATAACG